MRAHARHSQRSRQSRQDHQFQRGYSLLEFLFVICAMAIVGSVAVPQLSSSARRVPSGGGRTISLDTDSTNPHGSGEPLGECRDCDSSSQAPATHTACTSTETATASGRTTSRSSIDSPLGALGAAAGQFLRRRLRTPARAPPGRSRQPAAWHRSNQAGNQQPAVLLRHRHVVVRQPLYPRPPRGPIRDSRARRYRANPGPEVRPCARTTGNRYDEASIRPKDLPPRREYRAPDRFRAGAPRSPCCRDRCLVGRGIHRNLATAPPGFHRRSAGGYRAAANHHAPGTACFGAPSFACAPRRSGTVRRSRSTSSVHGSATARPRSIRCPPANQSPSRDERVIRPGTRCDMARCRL